MKLVKILGNKIIFKDADMLDGTPLIDIKPYAPVLDVFESARSGWRDGARTERTKADARFVVPGREGIAIGSHDKMRSDEADRLSVGE